MGHGKKLITTLFVVFVALVSTVAGGFAMSQPTFVKSNAAKTGDSATMNLYFNTNSGAGLCPPQISKTWDSGSKADASKHLKGLTIPSNHSRFNWRTDVTKYAVLIC